MVLVWVAVVALGAVWYLAFVFPRKLVVWEDQGRELSANEQVIAQLSSSCREHGILLISLLMAAAVGCGVWAALARQPPARPERE